MTRAIGPLARACNLSRKIREPVQTALTRLLSLHNNDISAIGSLVEALSLADRKLRAEIIPILTRLLPRMSVEDATQLSNDQLKLLNSYLGRNHYTLQEDDLPGSPALILKLLSRGKVSLTPDEKELALAILAAYPVIGNGTELSIVLRVTKGQGNAGKDAKVCHAAQEYLDLVERRKQQETLNTTLLRASAVTETTADTLLRAANTTASAPPDELLRPTTSAKEGD